MSMEEEIPVLASYPRRIARLFAYLMFVSAGVFYIFYPPLTSTHYLESSLPSRMWGVFFLIGGGVCILAWFKKYLIVDRIGLSLTMIGLAALIGNQIAIFADAPSLTRGGGTAILMTLFAMLVSRWQDVKHDEQLSEDLLNYTEK